jgi:putative nucleotidyltransferase with HDIG domain
VATRTQANKSAGSAAAAAGGSTRPPQHAGSHANRLAASFEAVDQFPALVASRDRVLELTEDAHAESNDLVEAVEGDVALVISLLRFANRRRKKGGPRVATVPEAIDLITPNGVEALARAMPTFDFLERTPTWEPQPEIFRLHALAAERAAHRVADAIEFGQRDELTVAAMLHDVGRLVLGRLYPGYRERLDPVVLTAEQRLQVERRELGVDHALVGGVLARRWDLPAPVARAIERHHADDAQGMAAILRLADMLARYGCGDAVSGDQLSAVAKACGVDAGELRIMLHEFPYSSRDRQRPSEPCPLSGREMEVLRRLAEGRVYKQIAHEMSLSVSTVRTHLHNVYAKIGAVDRAQAVLTAREKGWI